MIISPLISLTHTRFTVIILAGGRGSRMGVASEYIPKSLSSIGGLRAIDYIIERHKNIAAKFIIGIGQHKDILKAYVKGNYPSLNIEFAEEKEPESDAKSAVYCLDHANCRFPTIVVFSDLILLGNTIIKDDTILYTNSLTKGFPGTYRYNINICDGKVEEIILQKPAKSAGVVPNFCFGNTVILKEVAYSNFSILKDFTGDIVTKYNEKIPMNAEQCEAVIEFGDQESLIKARQIWEEI